MGPEDRRHRARVTLDHLAYIRLQSDNGGIVLNISENGLAFHAAAPIEAGELIRFRLSVKHIDRLEATGELAWNDEKRTSGGLRFIEVPDELQQQIQMWLGQPQLTAGSQGTGPAAQPLFAGDNTASSKPSKNFSPPSSAIRSGHAASAQSVSKANPAAHSATRLRTAFLLLLLAAALELGCASLFIVPHSVQKYVQEEIVSDTRNTMLEAQAALGQNTTILSRKAQLLATYAAMGTTNDSTLQDSIDNPLATAGIDLMVLTDGTNQITALHTSNPSVTDSAAEPLLLRSVQKGNSSDWWYLDGRLYQVVLASVDHSPLAENKSGTVVIGRQTDDIALRELGTISGCDLTLSYGGEIVASTLNTLDRYELARKLNDRPVAGEIQMGQDRFYASSVGLTRSSGPAVTLVVVKSYKGATGFLDGLDHLIIRLKEATLIILLGLAILVVSGSGSRLHFFTHIFWPWLQARLLRVSKSTRDGIAQITRAFDRMLTSKQS